MDGACWILGGSFIAPGEPYVAVGWPVLLDALGWAKSAGLSVVIDLHGAPGSQNGHDNSGRSGPIEWNNPQNQSRTTAVLVELSQRLQALNSQPGTEGVVVAIESLNEPWTTQVGGPIQFGDLAVWYKNATDAMRAAGWMGDIWHHDGFQPTWSGWVDFLAPPSYTGILLDTHQYFCFGGFDNLSLWQLVGTVCTKTGPGLQILTDRDWLVVGEMSMATDDSIAPPTPLTDDGRFFYRAFAEAQFDSFGALGPELSTPKGAFFWCHRTESDLPWSVLDGLQQGYFPSFKNSSDMQLGRGRLTCDGFST